MGEGWLDACCVLGRVAPGAAVDVALGLLVSAVVGAVVFGVGPT